MPITTPFGEAIDITLPVYQYLPQVDVEYFTDLDNDLATQDTCEVIDFLVELKMPRPIAEIINSYRKSIYTIDMRQLIIDVATETKHTFSGPKYDISYQLRLVDLIRRINTPVYAIHAVFDGSRYLMLKIKGAIIALEYTRSKWVPIDYDNPLIRKIHKVAPGPPWKILRDENSEIDNRFASLRRAGWLIEMPKLAGDCACYEVDCFDGCFDD